MAPKVSQEYKDEKRAQILRAALECFAHGGYQNTTLDDIAIHMGMVKGNRNIYTYFSSKDDLFLRISEEYNTQRFSIIEQTVKNTHSCTEKLHMFVENMMRQSLQELRLFVNYRIELKQYYARNKHKMVKEDDQLHQVSNQDLIEELIKDGKNSGEFRSTVDEKVAAKLFWALRDGIAMQFLDDGEQADYIHELAEMEKIILMYLTDKQIN